MLLDSSSQCENGGCAVLQRTSLQSFIEICCIQLLWASYGSKKSRGIWGPVVGPREGNSHSARHRNSVGIGNGNGSSHQNKTPGMHSLSYLDAKVNRKGNLLRLRISQLSSESRGGVMVRLYFWALEDIKSHPSKGWGWGFGGQ